MCKCVSYSDGMSGDILYLSFVKQTASVVLRVYSSKRKLPGQKKLTLDRLERQNHNVSIFHCQNI